MQYKIIRILKSLGRDIPTKVSSKFIVDQVISEDDLVLFAQDVDNNLIIEKGTRNENKVIRLLDFHYHIHLEGEALN